MSGWLLHIAEHLCRQIPRGGGGGGGGSSSSSSENPAAADADGAPKPARYGNATLFAMMPFDTKNADHVTKTGSGQIWGKQHSKKR